MPQRKDEIVRLLEANRGGAVRVHFRDGEVTRCQVLFVDDHIYQVFCHRVIETNRPDKHAGAYRAETSWLAALDHVERVEPLADGPRPWGPG